MTAPILRTVKGSPLTNAEVDQNFINLSDDITGLQEDVTTIVYGATGAIDYNKTIPGVKADLTDLIDAKQDLNNRLTDLTSLTPAGLVALTTTTGATGALTSRSIASNTALLTVTNGNGVAGNPTLDLSTDILTTNNAKSFSNKTISGNNNTITNVSLSTSVSGVLPVANGGTNATSALNARLSLGAFPEPASTGIAIKNASGTSITRELQAGYGVTVTNGTGLSGDPTVALSSTVQTILGNVNNLVYTTGTYGNPAWITSLAGSKVTSIPNSSLTNSGVTINGTSVALGGSLTVSNIANSALQNSGITVNGTTISLGGSGTITNIPNSSLANSSITINGNTVPLGGSATITASGLKAWVVFTGNPCAIISQSGNITSVTRLSVGRYRITINNGVFANGNFCITTGVSSFNTPAGGSNYDHTINIEDPSTATSVVINTGDPGVENNNVGHDVSRCHVMMIA